MCCRECSAACAISIAALHILSLNRSPIRELGSCWSPQSNAAEYNPHLEVCISLILIGAVDACHNICPRELYLHGCILDSMRPTAFNQASARSALSLDGDISKRHHQDQMSPQEGVGSQQQH